MNEMLTVSEAADLLKLSKITIYSLIKEGVLEAYKLNSKTIRISREALDRYIEGCRVK